MGDRYGELWRALDKAIAAGTIPRELSVDAAFALQRAERREDQDRWWPIDDPEHPAPRDGTAVLTWGTLHLHGEEDGERPAVQISRWLAMYESWVSGDWGSHEPVLWRPLPAPPLSGRKG